MTTTEQFPIRTLSALTGVHPVTLRAWERRHGLLGPVRTSSGHRLYTHAHVEEVRRVLSLLERGIPVSRVRPLLEAEAASADASEAVGPWLGYQARMAAAVAVFDEQRLDEVYDEALSLHPIDRVTHHVVLPLLRRLGERWDQLDGAIGEEHFFATYLRGKLGARLQHRLRYATGPRLVAACAPGEQHEVGLLLFAIEAREAGFRPLLLGADTPFDEVAHALRRSGADGVVISASAEPVERLRGCDVAELVDSTTAPVFVGGHASVRHRAAIASAGAIPLGTNLGDAVRLIAATLRTWERSK